MTLHQFVALVDETWNLETAKKGGEGLWIQQAAARTQNELEVEERVKGII